MYPARRRVVLLMSLACLLAVAPGRGAVPADAACAGGPCACGSVVDSDTALEVGVDPVCSTDATDACPANGAADSTPAGLRG